MATKVKKSYKVENKRAVEAEKKRQNDKTIKYPIAEDGIAAPMWRRLVAYLIDAIISLALTAMFVYSAATSEMEPWYNFLFMLSGFLSQVWLFMILPMEYTKGQTLGRKAMKLYVREIPTKFPLTWWKSFSRDYLYGILAIAVAIPFEIIYSIYQYATQKQAKEQTLQMLDYKPKQLILARDLIFNSEVVYLPKKKNKVIDVAN
ncbi:MAG: RDD family protein [Culicoidibacterales bacterium]